MPDSDRKRKIKLRGTKKLHAICPAKIQLFQSAKPDSKFKVSFWGEHVGHGTNDKKEIGFVSLHKDDRVQLASKIASGIPLQRIRDQIANEIILEDCFNSKLNRLDLLTTQDLHSVESTYNVKPSERKPRPFKTTLTTLNHG